MANGSEILYSGERRHHQTDNEWVDEVEIVDDRTNTDDYWAPSNENEC